MAKRIRLAALLAALLLVTASAHAQKAVFVVRHGEKISTEDERLSDAGRARAERLATILGNAGIAAVYSTDTERTRGTAQPLAAARHVPVTVYDDPAVLAGKVKADHPAESVLVVGHSNTVPELLKAFGCAETIALGAGDYDNLFVVIPKDGAPATLLRLKY